MSFPSSFPLTEIATLSAQYTVFPLITAMWFYNGSLIQTVATAVFGLFFYTLAVMFGANIQNPTTIFTGQAQDDAELILGTIDCTLSLFFAAIGFGFMLIMEAPILLPFGKHQPVGQRFRTYKMVQRDGDMVYTSAGADSVNKDAIPTSYGIKGLVPTWTHYLVTVTAYLLGVGVPQILYTWYMNLEPMTDSNKLLAWMLYDFLGIPVSVLLFLFLYYAGDTSIVGPGTAFIEGDPAGNQYGLTRKEVRELEHQRLINCALCVAPAAFMQIILGITVGGARFFSVYVNASVFVTIGAAVVLLIVLLIMTAVVIYRRRNQKAPASVSNRGNNNSNRRREDDDDVNNNNDDDDDDGSNVDETTTTPSTSDTTTATGNTQINSYLYRRSAHDVITALDNS
jgi:hypothetical protein